MKHSAFFDIACTAARRGRASGDLAAGAVLVKAGEVVARGCDRRRQLNDPISVPELDCIRGAGRRIDQQSLALYTTRYPDMLSAGAIVQFSIGRVMVGLAPPVAAQKEQGLALLQEKRVPVEFIDHPGCRSLLQVPPGEVGSGDEFGG